MGEYVKTAGARGLAATRTDLLDAWGRLNLCIRFAVDARDNEKGHCRYGGYTFF